MYSITRLLTAFLFGSLFFSTLALSQIETPVSKSLVISAADEAAVKSVVTQFFNLYPKKDAAAFSALWSEKSPYLKGHRQELERIFAGAERIEVKDINVGKPEADGERIKIR